MSILLVCTGMQHGRWQMMRYVLRTVATIPVSLVISRFPPPCILRCSRWRIKYTPFLIDFSSFLFIFSAVSAREQKWNSYHPPIRTKKRGVTWLPRAQVSSAKLITRVKFIGSIDVYLYRLLPVMLSVLFLSFLCPRPTLRRVL